MINSLETGGSERQFLAVENSLDREAYRVHLGCIKQQGSFLQGHGQIPSFPLGGSLYGAQSVLTRLRLARHLRRSRIALAHAFDFYTNLAMIPAARLAGVPVVIGSQRQVGDLLTPMQAKVQAAALAMCDRVVCNSRAAADRLAQEGVPERKIVVIGNGLPDAAFAEASPAIPRNDSVLRVGMIARMNAEYKRHRNFLAAAARVHARFPNAEFLLVGDGPLRPELEREADRLGIAPRVRFLGDRRDVTAVLAAMDVSVLPSASESLSNVILESMAAGVPVVATRVGGNPELLGSDRGVLVMPEDVEALAEGIERMLEDSPRREQLQRRGRAFARANFSMAAMAQRYHELYGEMLGRKSWRSVSWMARGERHGRIKVAVVAPSLRYVGGQSVQADALIRHWNDDPEIEAKLVPVDPTFPPALAWAERVPGVRTVVREPFYLRTLWEGLKDADVAHIFSASYLSFLLAPAHAWLVANLRGTTTLINYHSGEARDHLQKSATARTILRNADRLVVPSPYLVDVFNEFRLVAHCVPNTVDLAQFRFRKRRPLQPRLVCTRGFHRYYSVDVVVRAFATVKSESPGATLELVGGGPEEQKIRDLVTASRIEGVNFAGVAARETIAGYYDRADIFLNGSWLDNMPISILEAFASGTPVVTTSPECMPYLVEHERTGLLSPVGDAGALAANVIRLLRDPELAAALAENAHEESQKYSWKLIREEWLRQYRGLAGRELREMPAPGN
jgi:glycosyltransferase involved in cell wall biosynthesis